MKILDYTRFAIPLVANGQAKVLSHLRTLKYVSQLDSGELQDYVLLRRNTILKYALENVEFYKKFNERSKPGSSSSESFWQNLPFCDRDVISPCEESFISDEYTLRNWNDTSGSTGRRFRFIGDPDQTLWAEASAAFIREVILSTPVPKELVIWGASRDVSSSSGVLSRLKLLVRRKKYSVAYKLDSIKINKQLQIINEYEPTLLTSYPNILALLCQSDRTGVLRGVRAIMSAGEWLRPDLREKIESHHGKRIYDFYGTREMGAIAFECPERKGLHILSPMVFLEAIRPDGSLCSSGEIGELVVTSLIRKSMPLIRYRIGDMGSLSDERCSCGLAFPLIKDIFGRTMDSVRLPDGRIIAGYFWTHFARDVQGISQFRIVQNKSGSISLEIVPENKFDDGLLEKCESALADKLGLTEGVSVSLVKELPVNQSGKTGLVVSHYGKSQ